MISKFLFLLKKHHQVFFYSAWLILHLIQSYTTELFDDEAYYWMYSHFPAWGYFDHPPAIAMMIKAGYAIFPNELGVRLVAAIFSVAAIYLIQSLTDKKNPLLFYAICASLALAQIGGIMAVPDTPLMLFAALFFWAYRRFLEKMNLANSVLIALCITLLLYTKYHGVLIIFFTALSNLKLFTRYQPYLVILLSLALFIPHLYWQYDHGFPSVQFHLFERNAVVYEFQTTLEYIVGQIIMAGPLTGWLLILAALLYRPVNAMERALKYTFIGIYVFFLISTLKGKAEANWTIPSFIGMMVLSHKYLSNRSRWANWLYNTLPFTLLLVFAARIYMMVDTPPASWIAKDEFHSNRIWVNAVSKRAGNMPVVFLDTYQKPSKYWFYSGKAAMALNTPDYRRNNYNFWSIEDSLINRPAYVIGRFDSVRFNEQLPGIQLAKSGGMAVQTYYSFSRVLINKIKNVATNDGRLSVDFTMITPAAYLKYFQMAMFDTAAIQLAVFRGKQLITYIPSGIRVKDIVDRVQENSASFALNLPRGKYTGKLAINSCIPGHPSLNSSGFTFVAP